jgi:hypothetical protein
VFGDFVLLPLALGKSASHEDQQARSVSPSARVLRHKMLVPT